MLLDPTTEPAVPEMDVLYSQANSRLMEYGALAEGEPRVAALAAEAAEAQSAFLAAHRELNTASGAEAGALLGVAGLLLGEPTLILSGLESGVHGADAYAAVQRGYVLAFNRNRGAQLALRDLADRTNQSPARNNLIAVDFDESWHGQSTACDVVCLTNTAGATIRDAVISVKLTGADGSRAQNVHFVQEWKPEQPLFARYGIGATVGASTVGRQTVFGVESVEVEVWGRGFRCHPIAYQYAGAERDADIQAFIDDNLSLAATVFDNGILRYVWSLRLQLNGVNALPECHLDVQFHCGDQVIEHSRDVQSWSQGQFVNIIPDYPALPSKPSRVDVTLTFPENTCRWEQTYHVR
ncbi:MAG: hypothetical protein R3B68_06370 [Phycisphaerales bacterium]